MIGIDTSVLVQLEILEMPANLRAHDLLRREVLDANRELVLVPQVLAEFIHVVSDPRRFARPLMMDQALARARFWWNAREVRHAYPTAESTGLTFEWLARHGMGRKRILDTQLAATLLSAGVRRLLTSNAQDFAVFDCFELLVP